MPPPDSRQAAAKNASKAQTPADSGSSGAVLQECEELEAELASLRNAYEQYFLGIERHSPTRAHEDFKKRVNKLKTAFIRSTAAKFRVASLHNKYLTYERLWTRTLQEIEAGTYRRDLFKARRRAESRKGSTSSSTAQKGVVELPEDISDMEFEEVEEVRLPNEPKVAAVAPVTPAVGGTPLKGTPAVAPITPPVGGTPFKGTPAVAPVVPPLTPAVPAVTPAIPAVAPLAGTPARGLPTITPPLAGTPARGTPTPPGLAAKGPAGATPAGGVPARPAAAAPGGAVARTPSPAPTAAAPRPPAAAGSGGMSDDKLRAVYDAYVTAKRRCQEDTSKLSYESVAATLRKQVPELLKQHNAKAVEFKVVIKDGKASLKAVPK
jgi:hypothetical protein